MVHHSISYSRLLPIKPLKEVVKCEKQSLCHGLSITIRYLTFENTFEDLKFSVWTCLLLARRTVNERCPFRSTDYSIFSRSHNKIQASFDWYKL